MWFGTDNGLARFDGRRVQNFSFGEPDANRVLALKAAPGGELWIGSESGAFVYSGSSFQTIEDTEGIGIHAILLDGENFLGTGDGLVMRVRTSESGIPVAEKVSPQAIAGIDGSPVAITALIKKDGKLLAGSAGRGMFVVQNAAGIEASPAFRPAFVSSLAADADGKLWLGSRAAKGTSGIYLIDERANVPRIAAPTANVLALEANESGLWAGTERYGLFHFAASRLKKNYTFDNTSGGLRSDTIFTLFTDREGVIWIGTNRGVSRFDPKGPIQQNISDIPNSNFIRTLFHQRKDWILAGSNRGLFLWEGEAWKAVPGFDGKVIYEVAEHRSTELLIGTSTGLFDLSGKLIISGDTRAIANFQSRTYAAVFGRGVIGIPPGARGFGLFNPADGPPPAIYSDESTTTIAAGLDRLWIGTADHGLLSFDGRSVKSEAAPDVLKSGSIRKMFGSADGALWIAGEHGVFRWRDGQVEQIIAVEDVRDVFELYGQIWAATTTRGLVHARHTDGFGWLVSAAGFEQGLPSEKAFSIVPAGGDLIIATNRGIVTYKPGTVAPKLITVRVLSQRLHDLGELRAAIKLDHPQNSLLVEVAGQSSRTFPEEFQYSFVVKNSLGDTTFAKVSNDPQFAPTDLSPGDYSIESTAYDRDLNASEPLTIRFSIGKAPFPRTAAALGVLLFVAVVALIWAIIERRRIAGSNRELAAARSDLANEAERERSRIARDLHDQTLADLRNLMIMSDRLVPASPEFRSEIEYVSTEIRRICEDLSPSVLENVGLVSALEFLLGRTTQNHRFTANEDANELVKFPLIVQLHLYRIAQEVLTNITRHSDASLVEMSVLATAGEGFHLTILDDGSPFRPDGVPGVGRGIANIKSRAGITSAKISWESPRKGGNLFSLKIDDC